MLNSLKNLFSVRGHKTEEKILEVDNESLEKHITCNMNTVCPLTSLQVQGISAMILVATRTTIAGELELLRFIKIN